MCKWYIEHMYVKVHAQRVVLNGYLVVNVSDFAIGLSGKIIYLFLYVSVIITWE